MKHFGLTLYHSYQYMFDHNLNPLRHIPDPASRFMIMVILATGWSGAFASYVGSLIYFGWSAAAHLGLLFMVFFTASVFYDADRRGDSWLLLLRKQTNQALANERRCKWDLEKEA